MKLSLITGLLAFFGLAAEADYSKADYACPMYPGVGRDAPCTCVGCGRPAGAGAQGERSGRELGAFRYHAAEG